MDHNEPGISASCLINAGMMSLVLWYGLVRLVMWIAR